MRFVDILRMASSNLKRSKLRTGLTIVAIFIGAVTLTLTNGIGSGIATYIDEQVGNIGAEDMLIIQAKSGNPLDTGPKEYDPNVTTANSGGVATVVLGKKDIQKIAEEPGLKNVQGDYLLATEYIAGVNGKKFKAAIGSYYDGLRLSLAAGQYPDNKSGEHQILLTVTYLESLGFSSANEALGKSVEVGIKNPRGEVKNLQAKVVGVQEQTLMSAGGLSANRSLAGDLYNIQTEGVPAEIKQQQPYVTARFDTNIGEDGLAKLKADLDAKGYTAVTVQDQIGILKQVISAVIMVLNFFAGIALLAASFGIVNTLLMSVQERTKEIGLMKAVGMSRKKLFLIFSTEAILLGFWGSLLGSLAGVGVGKVVNRLATKTFLKDLVGFELTSFPATSIVAIMLIIMLIAFLAGTLPARRASKLDAIEALRYE
jgi:putative ABC transport system permease protein